MDTWDELVQQKEPSLTTDDLVLWIGEFTVKEKQQGRITAFQQQKIQALESEILKLKSGSSGLNIKLEQFEIENNRLKTEVANLTLSITTAQKEQHPRIVQLEEQVHSVALERDEAKKEVLELKSKPSVKRKK